MASFWAEPLSGAAGRRGYAFVRHRPPVGGAACDLSATGPAGYAARPIRGRWNLKVVYNYKRRLQNAEWIAKVIEEMLHAVCLRGAVQYWLGMAWTSPG